MVLNCPAWLRIPLPLNSDLRPSAIAIRQLRRPHLCVQEVLRLSWKRMDRQQNLSQRLPAAERGGPPGVADRDDEMGGEEDTAKAPGAFAQKESGCRAPGEKPCRLEGTV